MIDWAFRPIPSDRGRDYGNANIWAFKPDIRTLAKEACQNIIDAANGANATRGSFKIIELRGQDLARFLAALRWESLILHLTATSLGSQKLSSLLRYGLRKFADEESLLLLVVSDYGTTGLTGPEHEDGKFMALTRNNLDSSKGLTAGGAFGLGKATFWRSSLFSTVLFSSNLSAAQNGQQYGRLIGRSDLAYHSLGTGSDKREYAGPGWFGEVQASHEDAFSTWQMTALLEELYLDRGSEIGTSILVVGFHDPSDTDTLNVQTYISALRDAISDTFWPAIGRGSFSCSIAHYVGNDLRFETEVKPQGFTEQLSRSYHLQQYSEAITATGSAVERRVTLEVPRRIAETEPHFKFAHSARLVVCGVPDNGMDPQKLNTVALFRGTGMVIEYRKLERVAVGAKSFVAFVECGEYAEDGAPGRNAEMFLRTAEPPAHDEWRMTAELKADYAPPRAAAIERFLSAIREEIGKLVRPDMDADADVADSLKRLLQIESPTNREHSLRVESKGLFVDGRWTVEGTIFVSGALTGWKTRPVITVARESGQFKRLLWDTLKSSTGAELSEGYIEIAAGSRATHFLGTVDLNLVADLYVDPTLAALSVELYDTEHLT